MSAFEEILNDIKEEVVDLAVHLFKELKDDAISDANQIFEEGKDDFERWAELLAAKRLTPKDVEWLVKCKVDVATMTLLKRKGLTAVKIDKFKGGLFKIVTNAMGKAVGI